MNGSFCNLCALALWLSLLRRGSKGFFSGGEDPLSNVCAGTELHFALRIDITNAWTSAEERVSGWRYISSLHIADEPQDQEGPKNCPLLRSCFIGSCHVGVSFTAYSLYTASNSFSDWKGTSVIKAGVHMTRSEIWSNIKRELLRLKWVWNIARQLSPPK